jgi:hypothetical protein
MPIRLRTVVAEAAMAVTVPALKALEARVQALEASVRAQPLEPIPSPSGEGVQAKRIADLIESFGVNTFGFLEGVANLGAHI